MKTKINIMKDYRDIPFTKEVIIKPLPEAALVTKLHTIARGRKKTLHPDTVAEGDIVQVSMESSVDRYNKKNLPITVGKKLFDEELEKQLVGMKVSEEKEIRVGDLPVKVRVLSASRNEFPEPTDEEFLAYAKGQEELSGLGTVEEYLTYLKESYKQEQRNSAVYNAVNDIMEGALEQVDFEFDEEELAEEYEKQLAGYREEVKEEIGKAYEELTDDDFKAYAGFENREEFEENLHQGIEWQVAAVVWLAAVNGQDASQVTMDDEEAMDFSPIENYVRETIQFKEEQI